MRGGKYSGIRGLDSAKFPRQRVALPYKICVLKSCSWIGQTYTAVHTAQTETMLWQSVLRPDVNKQSCQFRAGVIFLLALLTSLRSAHRSH